MPRPVEYENLIRLRALEEVRPTAGAVAGFLKNAESFLALATRPYRSPLPPLSKAEAATMVAILNKYLPVARKLTGQP